jgi:hypothetical protein
VDGTEAAMTAKTTALFIPERDCFWEQEVMAGRGQDSEGRAARAWWQHWHGRMLSICVRVEAVWLVDKSSPRMRAWWSKGIDDDDGPVGDAQLHESIRDM